MGLQTRTTFSGSEHRSSSWHSASDFAAQRRADAETTLGLDDEWEDVPTAHLEEASAENPTADVGPQHAAPPVPPTRVREPAVERRPPRPATLQSPRQPRTERSPEHASDRSPDRSIERAPDRRHEHSRPARDPARSIFSFKQTGAVPPARAETPQTPLPRDIATGTLLCQRYVLGRLLGTGGSSLIFQAEDRRRVGAQDFGNRIAIKLLRQELRNNPHALTRLRREFRQMQRLEHPGIAKVYELACDEDIWFMTMELIEGQTINQWLKADTNRNEGLKLISACCEALHYAHDAGVVHGDLKPSNVLVLPNGGVKLVDFGSAAERDASMGVIDKERSFAATPPYASPQVLAGEVADQRDDVFSLACLAYGVLTRGEHPFERKSSAEAQQAQMRPAYAPGIFPREFEVIVRALAWDREQRPATVLDFMHALLASDLRRETPVRESAPFEIASKPTAPAARAPAPGAPLPAVATEPVIAAAPASSMAPPVSTAAAPPVSASMATASASPASTFATTAAAASTRELSRSTEVPKPATDVKPEDVARLKAAVAAAEAHANQIEARETKAPRDKASKSDPLDKFKGYVAGPHAPQDDEDALSAKRAEQSQPAPKKKWTWPWQRSALFGALLVGAAALVASQLDLDAEPIQQAEARPAMRVAEAARPVEPPVVQQQAAPVVEQVEEKKSPPVAVKPRTPPPAPGEVSFTTRTLQIGANQTVAALSVKRVNSTRGRAKFAWSIEGGTARPGVHYDVASPQTIEFLDGQSVRSVFIPLTPDKDSEGARHSKTFTVKLQPTTGGLSLGEIKQVHVTIVGDVADEEIAATTADTDN